MSRALFVSLSEDRVRESCAAAKVDVSATERLPDGGTRLVCSSSHGAATMNTKLKAHLIKGPVKRFDFRTMRPQVRL